VLLNELGCAGSIRCADAAGGDVIANAIGPTRCAPICSRRWETSDEAAGNRISVMTTVLRTQRLHLRHLRTDDHAWMHAIFGDPLTTRFYPHPFTAEHTREWISWCLRQYERFGSGLWAVILTAEDLPIGDCGISWQMVEGTRIPELGYHIAPAHQGRGYATEAACACRDYAFRALGCPRLYSYTRTENLASRAVARAVGMREERRFLADGVEQILHGIDRPSAIAAEVAAD
jgi:RimJ/RimL family protein N-acetyltransferase